MHKNKCRLLDVSFLIAIRIDSDERKENLITLIKVLSQEFDTSIIVLEADREQKFERNVVGTEFTYHFIYDADPVYHKTKYVNQLLQMAKTTYAFVWDVDVIASPEQIVKAVYRLRSKESFIVYPFDGRVHFVNHLISNIFRKTLRFDVLTSNLNLMDLTYGYYATGGAFIVDIKKYLQVGGENETIYGWGPEDAERIKRMEVLGLNVYYEEGVGIFHLWHPRKSNSRFFNKNIELRNRKEFLRTCKSNKETILSKKPKKNNDYKLGKE